MIKEDTLSRDLGFLATIVVVVGLITAFFLYDSGSSGRPVAQVSDESGITLESSREPQSLADSTVEELELGCLTSSANSLGPFEAKNSVRLSARICEDAKSKFQLASLVNDTNGFSATLFFPNPDVVTTDIIELKAGVNRLTLKWHGPTGTDSISSIVIEKK